jgi:hypothetical protein
MKKLIRRFTTSEKSAFVLALVLSVCAILGAACYSAADDTDKPEYLFIITGDTGTYKDGSLTLTGVPIVSFNYLGATRETGHFLVGSFVEVWDKNSSVYKAEPPKGTLSVLDEKGGSNAVIQVLNPSSTLNTLTFDAKILEGNVPDSFYASTLFLELKVDKKLDTQN